ncbi:MAG: hypothetical protein ACTSQ7_08340 [Alphaproteobacteria bacterium]
MSESGYLGLTGHDRMMSAFGQLTDPIHPPTAVATLHQLNDWTPAAISESPRPLTETASDNSAF